MTNNDLLEVKNLRTFFFTTDGVVKAVDGVSLTVSQGKTVGLVGESGCGKSATALSITRLLPKPPGKILEGEIVFRERDLLKLGEKEMRAVRGREIAMVFQNPMTFLNPVMKVGDQIADGIAAHHNISSDDVKEKVVEMLKLVRIPSPESTCKAYPHQLSGGMQQRIMIAAALSCKPSLLIADEPTTALDVTIQAQILNLIRRLIGEIDLSLLLITHDLGIVADVADTVYVMYAGKIVESSDVFSIYARPSHPYTEGLLRSVLSINKFKETIETIEGSVPDATKYPAGCRFHPRCSRAMDICGRDPPPPTVEIEKNHFVSCWLYC